MSSRLGRRFIIQSANGNDDLFAVARSVRHRAVTARTDLSRKASCFRQIVPRDQFLPGYPAKLIGHQRDIRRPHAAGRFPAARTIAVDKSEKRRPHLIADRFAKTTASKHLIGHRTLLIALNTLRPSWLSHFFVDLTFAQKNESRTIAIGQATHKGPPGFVRMPFARVPTTPTRTFLYLPDPGNTFW
jgi:hypothetical protein